MVPVISTYVKNQAFVTAMIKDEKLLLNAFMLKYNDSTEPTSMEKFKTSLVAGKNNDLPKSLSSTATISLNSHINNEGAAVFDLIIPGKSKITHVMFEIEGDDTKFTYNNLTYETYDISSLDFYNCEPTADYIICAGYNGKDFPTAYINDVNTYMHIIRRQDGIYDSNGKSYTEV